MDTHGNGLGNRAISEPSVARETIIRSQQDFTSWFLEAVTEFKKSDQATQFDEDLVDDAQRRSPVPR